MAASIVRASAAHLRIDRAERWLRDRPAAEEVLVVAAGADAANDLLRRAVASRGAAFGWHRATPGRLAAALAEPALARAGEAPVGRLACEALVARIAHELRRSGGLGRYERVADGPGFARAVTASLEELRLASAPRDAVARVAPELASLHDAYDAELRRAGLADRARVFALAAQAARDADDAHPWLGLPLLLLDVPLATAAERALVAAVAGRSRDVLATLPAGDDGAPGALPGAEVCDLDAGAEPGGTSSLRRLQLHLFGEPAPEEAPLGDEVSLLSTPGESRECVEIARRLLALARDGMAFDRMAILLRSPEEYRPHLEEALGRAHIPAHFSRGAVRPDPAGRALVALLACASEGLSARRFAEYLSLGEVPDATRAGAPPTASPDTWVAPDEELVPERIAAALETEVPPPAEDDEPPAAGAAAAGRDAEPPDGAAAAARAVTAGTLRAPRHWERLLVDASVIGGLDRWERRLSGLTGELALDAAALDAADDPARDRIRRDLEGLESLRAFALPLLADLDALPARASWAEWIEHLWRLAARALRHPRRVLAVLSELHPMAAIGPVDLAEVRRVLEPRLLELTEAPAASRYGRVLVAPADAARGLSFDAVFVPGLAERLFPRKIAEDPILLDDARDALAAGLPTQPERAARERLALRLAVGAARERLFLSYPRLDLDQSRPRVPSFYALEVLRAGEGRLPGFVELAARAEQTADARIGWPAPQSPDDAIDEAEHDLALLEDLLARDDERVVGTARYLLLANPHLGRALRFRARRWLQKWTVADGLVDPSDAARAAIAKHALSARSYSPTALQHYASCPYRFFLYAVHRLAKRDVAEPIEELDPLQRGSLVHEVQFELLETLREADLLPVTPDNFADARERLDRVIDDVAARYRDELAPAIERVFQDGVDSVRADLREWLRRAADDRSGFVPWRFELSFGLAQRRARDPHSVPEPVALDSGLALRGSIDLVERAGDGRLRATDHKTGRERFREGEIVSGGRALQPVLYALALEKLFPDARVESGRLYYCTSAGGFQERTVPLDATARKSAESIAEVIGDALAKPFLPAAPAEGACTWCDYRPVCGPYEELRTRRKWQPQLEALHKLRELP